MAAHLCNTFVPQLLPTSPKLARKRINPPCTFHLSHDLIEEGFIHRDSCVKNIVDALQPLSTLEQSSRDR